MAASVTIYTTAYCPYCVMAKRLLQAKSASFEEIDVSARPDLRTWLLEASKQRTVPQVFINGEPVGGFTDLSELDQRGVLETLLSQDPKASDRVLRR